MDTWFDFCGYYPCQYVEFTGRYEVFFDTDYQTDLISIFDDEDFFDC